MIAFGGGFRWGETTALERSDIHWSRERAHVVRGRRTARGVQGRRGSLGEIAASRDGSAPRPPRGDGPRGEREGLAAGGAPARFPEPRGPGHALRSVSRARLAAAPRGGQAPLPEASRHAPQLRDLDARGW